MSLIDLMSVIVLYYKFWRQLRRIKNLSIFYEIYNNFATFLTFYIVILSRTCEMHIRDMAQNLCGITSRISRLNVQFGVFCCYNSGPLDCAGLVDQAARFAHPHCRHPNIHERPTFSIVAQRWQR